MPKKQPSLASLLRVLKRYSLISAVSILLTFSTSARECGRFLNSTQESDNSDFDLNYFAGRRISVRPIAVDMDFAPDEIDQAIFKNQLSAAKIGQHIKSITKNKKKVSTVVYPSSGYDGVTGFLLFPEAHNVIGIDDHAFAHRYLEPLEPDYYASINDYDKGWAVVSEVGDKVFVVEVILARLKVAFLSLRIRKVYEVSEDRTSNGDSGINFSHGVIEFDLGPNTPVRKYIHLQSATPIDFQMRSSSWFTKPVLKYKFQALIRKASMSFFDDPAGIQLIKYLRREKGVLVDGDHEGVTYFSRDNYDEELKDSKFTEFLDVQNFGYGIGVRIYNF